jgi:hypothetical protein
VKIRFTINIEERNAAGVNPEHKGVLYRDVDWPTPPSGDDYIDIADGWGLQPISRKSWELDGTVLIELGNHPFKPDEAASLMKDEASWKLSAKGAGWPEWNGSIRTDTLTPDEWQWINDALEAAAGDFDQHEEFVEVREKVKALMGKG